MHLKSCALAIRYRLSIGIIYLILTERKLIDIESNLLGRFCSHVRELTDMHKTHNMRFIYIDKSDWSITSNIFYANSSSRPSSKLSLWV